MTPATMMQLGAGFSSCRRWRYWLIREVNAAGNGCCAFAMLNPSTADEVAPDPTVSKCMRLAKRWGYRFLIVVNIFAWRDTDPEGMKVQADPIGPDNDQAIHDVVQLCNGSVICAWGNHGAHLARGARIKRELLAAGIRLYHLGLNDNGSPRHPLSRGKGHVPEDVVPVEWT